MILVCVIQKLRPAEPHPPSRPALFYVLYLDDHVAWRIGVGEWLDQRSFNHAKNCRRCTDAQSQGEDRNSSKARIPVHHPQSKAEVLQ